MQDIVLSVKDKSKTMFSIYISGNELLKLRKNVLGYRFNKKVSSTLLLPILGKLGFSRPAVMGI